MSITSTNYINHALSGPPTFLLNWTTGLMRFYPWFMRVSMVLQRLVQ